MSPAQASADTAILRAHLFRLEQDDHQIRVVVYKLPQGYGGGRELTYVSVRKRGLGLATYSAPAVLVTPERFKTDLGTFGRMAAKFHSDRDLDPDRAGQIRGTYRGTIRFKGEDGYVDVNARHASGRYLQIDLNTLERGAPRLPGSLGAQPVAPRLRWFDLRASRRGENSSTFLNYYLYPEPADERGRAVVRLHSHLKNVRIARSRIFKLPDTLLTVDPGLASATFLGVPPMTGTASFTSPNTWLGDLEVPLLGAPSTRLAGPQFRARIDLTL